MTTSAALKYRAIREKRRNDPEIREKISRIMDSCDEALSDALELVRAAEAMLAKYPLMDDATYQCNLKDIHKIREALAQVVDCREKLDKERYINRFAAGRLGAEIQYLGQTFEL
jgi:hypothetical protein